MTSMLRGTSDFYGGHKKQKSCEFFHCNFSIKFFRLSFIYVKFQVFRAGIYVIRIRKYQTSTFELNSDKFKNLTQETHWSWKEWSQKEKMNRTEIFQNRSNTLNLDFLHVFIYGLPPIIRNCLDV